jgi:hypothetical protein
MRMAVEKAAYLAKYLTKDRDLVSKDGGSGPDLENGTGHG